MGVVHAPSPTPGPRPSPTPFATHPVIPLGMTGDFPLPDMATDPLVNRFRRTARPLLEELGEPLVVAVSGGGDSLALLHLVVDTALVGPQGVVAAHFDHALRPESAREAGWVMERAAALGVRGVQGRWSPPPAGNLAALAREARYAFLLECARGSGARAVLTAHQRDDQAETFMERLLRGSGTRGLGAMAPRRPLGEGVELVRPLLPFRRRELHLWLGQRGIPWLEDPGNADPNRRRARIRHHLLPCLAATGDGDPVERLAATAQRLQRAEGALEAFLERSWRELEPMREGDALTLGAGGLDPLPDELVCRVLVRAHRELTGTRTPPSARAQEGFLLLVRRGDRRWRMRVAGLGVERRGERLWFTPQSTGIREGNG